MSMKSTITLLSSATNTSTTTGSWVSTIKGPTQPILGGSEGYDKMSVYQTIGTVSGTTPTLDLTIEGSLDGGTTAFTLTPNQAWTQVTSSTNKQVRHYKDLPPLVRAVATIAGSSPTFASHEVKAELNG